MYSKIHMKFVKVQIETSSVYFTWFSRILRTKSSKVRRLCSKRREESSLPPSGLSRPPHRDTATSGMNLKRIFMWGQWNNWVSHQSSRYHKNLRMQNNTRSNLAPTCRWRSSARRRCCHKGRRRSWSSCRRRRRRPSADSSAARGRSRTRRRRRRTGWGSGPCNRRKYHQGDANTYEFDVGINAFSAGHIQVRM